MPSQVIGRVQPVNQGNYDATRAYVVLDRVKHQGAWYECQADAAAGAAPEAGGNAWWLEIGGRGADGLTPTPVWNGSELHFAYSDGTTTSAVDLQGPQGVQGEQGVPGQTPPLTSGLTSTAPDVALSALGGKTLKDLVDAAQATANGKANADLDNVTAAGKAVMAHAAMPDPSRVVQLSIPVQTLASWPNGYYQWTAPVDCCVSIQTAKSGGTGSVFLRVAYGEYTTADSASFRDNTVAADEDVSGASSAYLSVNFFVPKNQTITIVHNCPYAAWGKYFPCIGTAS